MTETREERLQESPLVTDRGTTTISDKVVATIAGNAAREVGGVHMGGSTSRSAGGLLQNVTGSDSQTRGVSVEVGRTEAAVDLTMGVQYGRNIIQTVEEVRRRISSRVSEFTGLNVTECNVVISDVIFPDADDHDGSDRDGSDGDTRALPGRAQPAERRPSLEDPDVTRREARSRTHTEAASGPVPEEEVRVERRPLPEDQTAEIRPGEGARTTDPRTTDAETTRAEPRSGGGGDTGETMEQWRASRRAPSGGSGSGSGSTGADTGRRGPLADFETGGGEDAPSSGEGRRNRERGEE